MRARLVRDSALQRPACFRILRIGYNNGTYTSTRFEANRPVPTVGIVIIFVLTVSDGSSILLDLFYFVGIMGLRTSVSVLTFSERRILDKLTQDLSTLVFRSFILSGLG